MAEPIVIDFVARGVKEIEAAFASVEQRMLGFEKAASAATEKESKKRQKAAQDEAKAREKLLGNVPKVTETAEKGATAATDKETKARLRAEEKAAKAREQIVRNSSLMAGRLAKQQADAEIREIDRVARHREQIAKTLAGKASASVGRAVGGVSNLVGGALTVGGGFAIADSVRRQLHAETAAAQLANAAYVPGDVTKPRQDPADIMAHASRVAATTGIDKAELIEAQHQYVAKSADFAGSKENLEFFAKLSKGSGAQLTDIMKAAGSIRVQNPNMSAQQMKDTMLAIVAQGRQGSIEISDLAKSAPVITATSAMYAGNQTDVQRKLLGLSQVAARATGSPEEAATSVSRLGTDALKHADVMKAMGVKFEGGNIQSPEQMIEAVLSSSKGNLQHIMKVGHRAGFDARSLRVFEPLAQEYQQARETFLQKNPKDQAGAEKAGLNAAMTDVKNLMGSRYTEKEANEDFATVMATPAEKFRVALEKLETVIGDKAEPELEKLADKLPELIPEITKVIESMGKLAEYFIDNPFTGIGAIVLASISKDIAAAGLSKGLEKILESALTGMAGGTKGLGGNAGVGDKLAAIGTIATLAVATATIGMAIIDKYADAAAKDQGATAGAEAGSGTATGTMTPEQIEKAKQQLATLEEQQGKLAPDVADTKLNKLLQFIGPNALPGGTDQYGHTRTIGQENLELQKQKAKQLADEIDKLKTAIQQSAKALQQQAEAAGQLGGTLASPGHAARNHPGGAPQRGGAA